MTSNTKLLKRRGAVLVEGGIVLTVMLIFLLGFFDLGVAVTRYNALSESARRAARTVIVRGEDATTLGASWSDNNAAHCGRCRRNRNIVSVFAFHDGSQGCECKNRMARWRQSDGAKGTRHTQLPA